MALSAYGCFCHLWSLQSSTLDGIRNGNLNRVQGQHYRFGYSSHGNNWSQKIVKKAKKEILRVKGVGGEEGEMCVDYFEKFDD